MNSTEMILSGYFMNLMRIYSRSISSYTTSIVKVHRQTYFRTYPTMLVFPDGSTTTIRYSVPRKIIRLPLDLTTLSDDEKRLRLDKIRPKSKVQSVEAPKVAYDPSKYIKLIKKK